MNESVFLDAIWVDTKLKIVCGLVLTLLYPCNTFVHIFYFCLLFQVYTYLSVHFEIWVPRSQQSITVTSTYSLSLWTCRCFQIPPQKRGNYIYIYVQERKINRMFIHWWSTITMKNRKVQTVGTVLLL